MRLEHALGYVQQVFNQTMQNLSKEMVTLRENQEAIADSFDINLRAMEVMFRNLGVSDETQKSILKAIETDFFAEKEKLAAEQKPAPVSAMTEQARIEEELSVISSESKKVIV
jgi:DNA polymerase III alpha subunit